MVFQQQIKEYNPRTNVSYCGLISYEPNETILRIEGMNFVLPGNLENIGRTAKFGHIETHDMLEAIVILEHELGRCSIVFHRKF